MSIAFHLIFLELLIMASTLVSSTIPNVEDFFPEIENDLSRVTWGHAINSEKLLTEAIANYSYMMLEADVLLGTLTDGSSSSGLVPIMAHPPDNTSDVSLEMWIDKVIAANKKGQKMGVKLDFKDESIVHSSIGILRRRSPEISFPLWLNADILSGPGGEDRTPVDAELFLSPCTEFFPDATLSLGWTTGYTAGGAKLKYTDEMVEEMVQTLEKNHVNQPVTFPVRAAFVGSSLDELQTLFADRPGSTFTVWTAAADDDVSIDDLAQFQNEIGSSGVYFDLPEEEMEELRRIQEEASSSLANTSFQFNILFVAMLCIAVSLLGARYLGIK